MKYINSMDIEYLLFGKKLFFLMQISYSESESIYFVISSVSKKLSTFFGKSNYQKFLLLNYKIGVILKVF